MPVKKTDKIWMNGTLVNWDDAKVHVLSHALHYGSSWFEGIRCYNTERGPAIFRLERHIRRLFESTRIHHANIPFSPAQLEKAVIDTVRANKLQACYIRPLAYRGYGEVGVYPLACPVDVSIAVWEWGTYLGQDALDNGIDVCVSTWHRPAANTVPQMAKAGGNYLLTALMKVEAIQHGYKEAIALDVHGDLAEGSGENLFLVRDGILHTPPVSSSLLPGITRSSMIQFAREAGYSLREEVLPREFLYLADEIFLTGTAAEVTPVRSVDRIPVGDGRPGPVTKKLQEMFFDVVKKGNDTRGWLTPLS